MYGVHGHTALLSTAGVRTGSQIYFVRAANQISTKCPTPGGKVMSDQIYVSRIVGDSFDLQTGKEISSGIELSNGIRSVSIPVSPDKIKSIVELYIELQAGTEKARAVPTSMSGKERVEDEPEAPEAFPVPLMAVMPDTFTTEEQVLTESTPSRYQDPDTGTESI